MAILFRIIADFFLMLSDFFLALQSEGSSFKISYKRLRHMHNGHPYAERERKIDSLKSEVHPSSNAEFVYTVNIVECKCGLIYQDCGLQFRDRSWITPETNKER
jgi:hypothetical protein